MNLPTLQLLFKFLFVIGISIFFAQCKDDAAREAARKAALTQESKPATEAPAEPANKPVRPPTSGTLNLQARGGSAAKGEEFCVSVTANDFRQIVSMQYSMKWDPKVLQFVNVKNLGLPGLTGNNFGGKDAENGILTFSWFDANVQGISQNPGHQLYDVCFRTVGDSGSQTRFQFTDAPVIIEITNSASLFLDLNGMPAVVKVQ